jgi:hypothetical protein
MIVDYEKDYCDFAKYVSCCVPVAVDDAKVLYGVATLNGYTRDEIIEDLIQNDGKPYITRRKMFENIELYKYK